MALTDKQETFCREYLIDLNATQAAIRAGYSENTAQEQGSQNLSKLIIQKRIAELKAERNGRLQIDADYVLQQAVKLHERCMQEVRPKMTGGVQKMEVNEDNDLIAYYEFNASGAAKALELIGKHVDVQAFRENVKASINDDRVQMTQLNNISVEKLKEIRKVIKDEG